MIFNHLKQKEMKLALLMIDSLVRSVFGIKPDDLRHLSLVVILTLKFSTVSDLRSLKMWQRKFFHFLLILLVCAVLKTGNHKRLKHRHRSDRSSRQAAQNFHEVDAFGDDFIDFGAMSGPRGQFLWHADFPLEWRATLSIVHQFRLIANIYFL